MNDDLTAMHDTASRNPGATYPPPGLNKHFDKWKRFDQELLEGKAKLDYDVQAFRLTADGAPRLFIRAKWVVDKEPVFLMTAWLNTGPNVIIEAADSRQSEIIRIIEGYDPGFDDIGRILGVFDSDNDGRGEVLILTHGWESFGIELLQYTGAGPVEMGASIGGGA
jgi:hypothetical protein